MADDAELLDDLTEALGDRIRARALLGWAQVARTHGGAFSGETSEGIDAELGSVVVHVDTYRSTLEAELTPFHEDPVEDAGPLCTRWRAPFLLGEGPRFLAYRSGASFASSRTARSTGYAVEGRHPDYDRLSVGTPDPEATRQAIGPAVNDELLRLLEAALSSDGRVVKLRMPGRIHGQAILEAGIRVVASVARAGEGFWRGAIEQLSDAAVVAPAGSWKERSVPYVALDDGAVRVTPAYVEGGYAVACRALPLRALPRFDVGSVDGELDGELGAGDWEDTDGSDPLGKDAVGRVLGGTGRELLERIGAVRLRARSSDEVEVVLLGRIDPERVQLGAQLVSRIARGEGPHGGAFR